MQVCFINLDMFDISLQQMDCFISSLQRHSFMEKKQKAKIGSFLFFKSPI